MENLQCTVNQVISKQESVTTPAHVSDALPQQVSFPNPDEPPPSSVNQPLSPTAMESLQEMVSRTLAAPSMVIEALSPKQAEAASDPPVDEMYVEQNLSMVHSLLESPTAHQSLPFQPTSTSNILNPLVSQPSQSTGLPPLLRNLSYNSMQHQHQQHQQQLQQLHEQQQQVNQTVRNTATFEEQQQRLDNEVRLMEDKMLQMELGLKQMQVREQTVRKELALTLKEVKHWKAQAKKAATEEEKNRILTEMLHELVPSSATPRKHNKTPTSARGRSFGNDERQNRKTQVDPEDREQHQHKNYHRSRSGSRDDERDAYGEHPPRSNRHSDVGAHAENKRRYSDAPPAVPLRRIQSESHQRRGRSSEQYEDDPEYTLNPNHPTRRKPQSERVGRGNGRWMEPNEIRMGSGGGGGRRYAEPQGAHVENESFANARRYGLSRSEEDSDAADFAASLVGRIAKVQEKHQKEKYQTRNYKRAERIVHQRRRDAKENGVWQPVRDPESSKNMTHHRRAKKQVQRMVHSSTPTDTSATESSAGNLSGEYFYVRE